jgi:2,3-bisphosphoglycerate-independent phosphoglycerate mutase
MEKESLVTEEVTTNVPKAVTTNVTKNFTLALRVPVWGELARKVFAKLTTQTNAVVKSKQEIAKKYIADAAEVLKMLAVDEEKVKDGKVVKNVRLVADG